MRMVERPLDRWLLTFVQCNLQDDFFSAQRKVAGQEDTRDSPLTEQRLKAEFLKIFPGLRKRRKCRPPASRLAEKAMVPKL